LTPVFAGSSPSCTPNARVAVGVEDGLGPAKTGGNMGMSLSAFKGGIVTFVWN